MVDKTNAVGASGSVPDNQSRKSIVLSDLQSVNRKLYEYFKKQNMSDDSYVSLSDIEKLKLAADKNDNGKISVREAKKIGFDGSRKEIKSMISSLDQVNAKINASDVSQLKKDEHTTEFYRGDTRFKSVYKEDGYEFTTLYSKDGKTPKETLEEKIVKGEKIKTKTVYYEGAKNYSDIETDKERITQIYNPSDDKHLVRSVKTLKSDPNSTETTVYTNGSGLSGTETITYEGQYVKDGVTERKITYNDEGKVVSNKTNLDEHEQVLTEIMEDESEEVAQKSSEKVQPKEEKPSETAQIKKAKPKVKVKRALSEADKIKLSSKEALDSAKQAVDKAKKAKLNPKVGLDVDKVSIGAKAEKPKAETVKQTENKPVKKGKVSISGNVKKLKKYFPNAEVIYDKSQKHYSARIKTSVNGKPLFKVIQGSANDVYHGLNAVELHNEFPNAEVIYDKSQKHYSARIKTSANGKPLFKVVQGNLKTVRNNLNAISLHNKYPNAEVIYDKSQKNYSARIKTLVNGKPLFKVVQGTFEQVAEELERLNKK